jgi:hypothetical protein
VENGEAVKQGVRLTKKVKAKAFECLKAEVAEMNMFIHGDVYGSIVTCLETEEDESYWGTFREGRVEIQQLVKDILPSGMTAEEEDAVINALEWVW